MGIGKRQLARARRRIQVRYGEQKPVRIAFTEDLHREGFFVKTAQPARPGTHLCFEMIFPEHGTVTLRGQVQWARKVPANLIRVANKGGMGIRILEIDTGAGIFDQYCEMLKV